MDILVVCAQCGKEHVESYFALAVGPEPDGIPIPKRWFAANGKTPVCSAQCRRDYESASTKVMRAYRKKPIVIQAEQWEPGVNDHIVEATGMVIGSDGSIKVCGSGRDNDVPAGYGLIPTIEGAHIVSPGDWIIIGTKGERYPCKPDIFEMTYELA